MIFIDFLDFHGFGGVLDQKVRQPVAACGSLWQPVAACGTGVRPPIRRIAQSCWGPPDLDDPRIRSSSLGDDDDDGADDDSWDV